MDDQRSNFVGCGVEESGVSVAVGVQAGGVRAIAMAAAEIGREAKARGADVGAVEEDDGVKVGDGGVHGGDSGVWHQELPCAGEVPGGGGEEREEEEEGEWSESVHGGRVRGERERVVGIK